MMPIRFAWTLLRFSLLWLALASTLLCQTPAPLAPNSPPGQPNVHTGMRYVPYSPCAPTPQGMTWRDGSGQFRTQDQLRLLLQSHNSWSWTGGKSGAQADLNNSEICNADLHDLNLRGIKLVHAKLARTNLERADLAAADLSDADLTGADLQYTVIESATLERTVMLGANLQHAIVSNSNLHEANFAEADLRSSTFRWSDLRNSFFFRTNASGAVFWQVKLADSIIRDAEFSGTYFFAADVNSLVFEPSSLPAIRGLATSANLEKLTYSENPDALFQLRKQFQDGGFLAQERKTTYALRRTESTAKRLAGLQAAWRCGGLRWLIPQTDVQELTRRFGSDIGRSESCSYKKLTVAWIDYRFGQVLFDWTCRYGMEPSRCLKLLLIGIVLWGAAYFVFMHLPARFRSGVYRISAQHEPSDALAKTKIGFKPVSKIKNKLAYLLACLKGEFRVLGYALLFSLLTAFNVGFRDITPGHWIRLLTVEEYDLKAEGWARPISGIQSLFSLMMVALWFLAYFGRPFAQ